jgi:MOSC domain-containing protein
MRVTRLWRYPVKSMQGERLEEAVIGNRGIVGDRQWAVVALETGKALTARREPRLLYAFARLHGDDGVEIDLPDGQVMSTGAGLSAWLGYDVELRRANEDERGTYEIATDFEHEDTSEWISWNGPRGSFHDNNRTQVSIATESSFDGWDERRFRFNVILDGSGEAELIGRKLQIGDAVVDVVKSIGRCVITTRPQPGGIERDLDVLRTINARTEGQLGIGALVLSGGKVSLGDELQVVDG